LKNRYLKIKIFEKVFQFEKMGKLEVEEI
jgi:hypothetical protein